MSNPFGALRVYGQDQQVVRKVEEKPKKVGNKIEDKPAKQAPKKQFNPTQQENLPTRIREDAKTIRNKRQPKPQKQLTQGHFLDRRSGTGRADRPRKEGGGRGNVGNLHDQQIKDKYIKEGQEDQKQTQQEVKPEEPQGLTLQEYYKSKGIELNSLTEATKKQPIKKGEVNAEWIKKQKLTVLQTKQEKRNIERGPVQAVKKQFTQQIGQIDESQAEFLGFNSKKEQKTREQHRGDKNHHHDDKGNDRGRGHYKGSKKQKIVINEEDFPTL